MNKPFSQIGILRRQLEDSKKLLEEERSSTDTPTITAERHAQLLAKVYYLNNFSIEGEIIILFSHNIL